MSGMKIALSGARVKKELDVLLISDESVLNLFSAVFSNAIIECHPSQKDLSIDFFPVPVFMHMWVFYKFLMVFRNIGLQRATYCL